MKAAIYIEQGVVQIVLTPDDEWEKNALKMIKEAATVKTFKGDFYYCQGGWYRRGPQAAESLMFLLEGKKIENDIMGEITNG